MSEDTQAIPAVDGELFWNAQVAAWPRLDRRFFMEYADTGEDFRKATEAGVKAVADAVRARFAKETGALLDGWRETLRGLESAPLALDTGGCYADTATVDTLRGCIRDAEEAVNAALKDGTS